MARKPMVTRTIKVTQACVLCLDIEHGEPCTKEVTLPRTYKNDDAILKAAKAAIDTYTLKAVSISKSWVEEKLLGMPEDFFIAHAVDIVRRKPDADIPVPPRDHQ